MSILRCVECFEPCLKPPRNNRCPLCSGELRYSPRVNDRRSKELKVWGYLADRQASSELQDLAEWILTGNRLYAIAGEGLVKLGKSRTPSARLAALQTSHHQPLSLLGSVPECVVTEKQAHQAWVGLRRTGEWFELTPELRAWIATWPELESAISWKLDRVRNLIDRIIHPRPAPINKLAASEKRVAARLRDEERYRECQAAAAAAAAEYERRKRNAIENGCARCRCELPESRWKKGVCNACTNAEQPDSVAKAEARYHRAQAQLAAAVRNLAFTRVRRKLFQQGLAA